MKSMTAIAVAILLTISAGRVSAQEQPTYEAAGSRETAARNGWYNCTSNDDGTMTCNLCIESEYYKKSFCVVFYPPQP